MVIFTAALLTFKPPPAQAERQSDRFLRGLLPKKSLSRSKLGINAFVNDQRFGSIRSQFREVKGTLRLKKVRILFAWNDDVQPSPGGPIDFSFYDEIARSVPSGVQALVILTGLPSWMDDSRNWVDGDPRKTFAERWVRPVLMRYGKSKRLKAYQIWNEPNMTSNSDNTTLEISDSPENFADLTQYCASVIREIQPRRKIVSGATTAINQNFPDTLNYNKDLKEAGLEGLVDFWGAHFYGEHLETLLFPGGVADFLNGLSRPVWVTESGEQGVNSQLEYAQEFWPFLFDLVPSIKRLYIYQFTEATPASSTYGLKNLTPRATVSDLYIYLRDRAKR